MAFECRSEWALLTI